MHSSSVAQLSTVVAVVAPVTPARATAVDRRPVLRSVAILALLEHRAERDLRAHFARPRASASNGDTVDAVLAAIPAHHRGVLRLNYTPRVWPDAVTTALGEHVGVAIRLYCADHPAEGPTPVLEQAAAERIAAIFTEDLESPKLLALSRRAARYHRRALRAYVTALAKREEVQPA
jgi:hypothetical protein